MLEPWSVRLRKLDSGWTARSSRAPDELMMSRRPSNAAVRWLARTLSVTFWQPLSGTVVRAGDPATRIVVPAALHAADTPDTLAFRIAAANNAVTATLGKHVWVVSERGDTLSYRNQEGLRRGRYLSELRPAGVIEAQPVADLVRVRRLRASERVGDPATLATLIAAVGERIFGGLSGPARYLVSAESPVEIAASGARVAPAAPSNEASEIVARSGEDVWRFSWRPEANGVAVEFLRRPKKRLLPLTATSACPAGSACNIVSLKRVPPPSPQFLLSEGGLDSSRFELFGRLAFDENTVWYIGDATRVAVSGEEGGTAITAKRIGAAASKKASQAAVILIARRGSLSASWDVLKVAVGVFCILMCLFGMIRMVLAQGSGFSRAIDERPLALAINGLLALGLARLILGTRVTAFPPFALRLDKRDTKLREPGPTHHAAKDQTVVAEQQQCDHEATGHRHELCVRLV